MSKTPSLQSLPRFKVKTAAADVGTAVAPPAQESLFSRLMWRPDDVRLLKDTISTQALPFAAGGAAVAGAINLISAAKEEKRRREFDNKMKEQGNSDIVIQIPAKTAADAPTATSTQGESFSPLWRTSIALGVPALAAYGGYKLVDVTTDALAKKNMDARVKAAKRKYYDLITSDGTDTSVDPEQGGIKTAGIPAYPVIEGFCSKIAEELTSLSLVEGAQKDASVETAPNGNTNAMDPVKAFEILTSIYPALAIGSGLIAHKYIYDRKTDIDELYSQKKDRINKKPKRIRFVTAPAPTQSIEAAPDQALPQQETGSVPIKQANQILTTAALSTALSKNLDDLSPEAIADKMVQSDQELQNMENPAMDPTDVSGEDVVADKQNIKDVDENTLMVDTPAGKVRVDASDPAAMEYIRNNKHVLASAINSAMQESVKPTDGQVLAQ